MLEGSKGTFQIEAKFEIGVRDSPPVVRAMALAILSNVRGFDGVKSLALKREF